MSGDRIATVGPTWNKRFKLTSSGTLAYHITMVYKVG